MGEPAAAKSPVGRLNVSLTGAGAESGRLDDDPHPIRWGCFLPDLTRLARDTSATNLPGVYLMGSANDRNPYCSWLWPTDSYRREPEQEPENRCSLFEFVLHCSPLWEFNR